MGSINSSNFSDQNVNVLDCTFRDGGYYTNWHFDDALVDHYFSVVPHSRVNIIELGYVSPSDDEYGTFHVDRLSKFSQFVFPSQCRFAAMIDAKKFLSDPDWKESLRKSLLKKEDTGIDIIRIACHYNNLKSIDKVVGIVKELGYTPVLNLMQVDGASNSAIDDIAKCVSQYRDLAAVYIADSFGSMVPSRVRILTAQFVSAVDCAVGFHAHDNMGMALINTVEAMNAGATWIDSTIAGMGRGAGNVATEKLCAILDPGSGVDLNELIINHFSTLKQKYGWGENILYRLAGQKKIHPMYIQSLTVDADRSFDEMAKILRAIPISATASFDQQVLSSLINAD